MAKKCDKGEKKDARGRCRDYDEEYKRDHSSKEAIADRTARGRDRKTAGCKKGQEVDHRRPLSKGGTSRDSNLQCISLHENRTKGSTGH